eukprot:scaffold1975_cov241-Pinguiococcus_pyrenoidosus.AAC.6
MHVEILLETCLTEAICPEHDHEKVIDCPNRDVEWIEEKLAYLRDSSGGRMTKRYAKHQPPPLATHAKKRPAACLAPGRKAPTELHTTFRPRSAQQRCAETEREGRGRSHRRNRDGGRQGFLPTSERIAATTDSRWEEDLVQLPPARRVQVVRSPARQREGQVEPGAVRVLTRGRVLRHLGLAISPEIERSKIVPLEMVLNRASMNVLPGSPIPDDLALQLPRKLLPRRRVVDLAPVLESEAKAGGPQVLQRVQVRQVDDAAHVLHRQELEYGPLQQLHQIRDAVPRRANKEVCDLFGCHGQSIRVHEVQQAAERRLVHVGHVNLGQDRLLHARREHATQDLGRRFNEDPVRQEKVRLPLIPFRFFDARRRALAEHEANR